MTSDMRPHPDDPDSEYILAAFDMDAAWTLAAAGDYQAGAAQAMRKDGSNLQNLVLLEWPGRINKSDDKVTVRLAMRPQDALGLADVLRSTGTWMLSRGLA